MNIITDPTSLKKVESSNKDRKWFSKTTFNYNNVFLNDKLALSGTIVRKT